MALCFKRLGTVDYFPCGRYDPLNELLGNHRIIGCLVRKSALVFLLFGPFFEISLFLDPETSSVEVLTLIEIFESCFFSDESSLFVTRRDLVFNLQRGFKAP